MASIVTLPPSLIGRAAMPPLQEHSPCIFGVLHCLDSISLVLSLEIVIQRFRCLFHYEIATLKFLLVLEIANKAFLFVNVNYVL